MEIHKSDVSVNCCFALSCTIAAETRSEFTLYHLNSAKLFVNSAIEIENQSDTEAHITEAEKLNHASYLSSAIITIVAALESNINSLFVDFQKHYNPSHKDKETKITKDSIDLFLGSNLFDKIRDSPVSTLSKYSTYSMLKTKQDITQAVKQDLQFIIDIRNKFIHFTPRWSSQKAPKGLQKLEKTFLNQYARKFKQSPFFNKDNHVFPYQCLSAGFVEWCVITIDEFITEFIKNTQK